MKTRKCYSNTTFILLLLLVFFFITVHCLKPLTHNSFIPSFIPSSTFCGAKHGYVFKTNDGHTGYYLDK